MSSNHGHAQTGPAIEEQRVFLRERMEGVSLLQNERDMLEEMVEGLSPERPELYAIATTMLMAIENRAAHNQQLQVELDAVRARTFQRDRLRVPPLGTASGTPGETDSDQGGWPPRVPDYADAFRKANLLNPIPEYNGARTNDAAQKWIRRCEAWFKDDMLGGMPDEA